MSKTFVMKKDNAIVHADAKLAAELRLRGYKEEGEAAAEVAASQPNPYTAEEVEAIKKQAEILETENAALRAAAAEVRDLESEKAENPTVPAAQPEDKADEHKAEAHKDEPAPKSRKK